MKITLEIESQDLIQMINKTYQREGYDLSEIKTETIVNIAANVKEVVRFDCLLDTIKFNTTMYYFYPIPGKCNMDDFKEDYSYLYPWEAYVSDCEELDITTNEEEWYFELAERILEGAIITEYGIIVRS